MTDQTESDIDHIRKAAQKATGEDNLTAHDIACLIHDGALSRRSAVSTFACRLGLEPHAEPAGKLMFNLMAPVRVDGSRKTGPRIIRLEIRRKDIRMITKEPLTAEEHAAMVSACAAFDHAIAAVPDGDPPDFEFFLTGEDLKLWTYRNPKLGPFFAPANVDREVVRQAAWRFARSLSDTVAP